jgi:hypothetical protein
MKRGDDDSGPRREALPQFLRGLAWGLAGAAPCAAGAREPLELVTWIALIAPAAGFHSGARGVRAWPYGLLAPAVWMIAVAWVGASRAPSAPDLDGVGGVAGLPTPVWAALAWTGLCALGHAAGLSCPRAAWRGAGALFLLSGLLCALPLAGGEGGLLGGRPVGRVVAPGLAARLFDLSPAVVLGESAGADLMRHRSVYGPAGTEWFSDRRAPYRGMLAGPTLLLVGCVALLAASRRRVPARE